MIKDDAYVINLDKYKSMGAHWITLYVYRDNVTCFCSLGVEYIQRVFKIFIGSKNIIANVYRIQSYLW